MNLSVRLSNWNGVGLIASLENETESFGDRCDLVLRKRSQNHREVCLEAARKLRIAAIRFELLSEEEKPCHAETHKKIARMKIPLPGAAS